MSNNKEVKKTKENILSNKIKKELNLLPKILKEKKFEIAMTKKQILSLKEKWNLLNKELEKISLNIISLEKDFSLLMIKNDNIKSNQKILLNSINNEFPSHFNKKIFLKKFKKLRDIIIIFLNFEKGFNNELPLILDNNNEITTLLIGSYSYLKMLQKDIPQKYEETKNKINNELIEIKELNEDFPFNLIINYIENIFIILDNREKSLLYEKKNEALNQKKNEIFIKLKLIEEQKKEKEININAINNYINELILLIDKYKLLIKYSKNKINLNFKENKNNPINNITNNNKNIKDNNTEVQTKIMNENNKINNLNISCPNNPCFKKEFKNTFNEVRNTNDKNNYINIDLTNIYNEKQKNNKKTIESFDDINSKINNSHSIIKKVNMSNYNYISDLEKDIYDNYVELKTHPLYSIKINNKNNNNISKNKILKKKINNNETIKKRKSCNKSSNTNRIEKNILNSNTHKNIAINQSNTTMTYNNKIIINNSNEMNKSQLSNNSKDQDKKINHYISTSQIKKVSPSKKLPKKVPQKQIYKPENEELIPYLTQDFQNIKENQRKTNETLIRRRNCNKDSKNILKTGSPVTSPNKIKNLMNINDINNKIFSSFPISNLDIINCNSEQLMDKINQSLYSKISKNNIYISIKHNKTNLCKEELNIRDRKIKKPLNKIKMNISKKEIKKFDKNNLKNERKNSPFDQSSDYLFNILNNDDKNKNKEKSKAKEVSKFNLDENNSKKKSHRLQQRRNFDKLNKEIDNIEITTNDKNNKNVNNSLINNINKNCHVIPFKKYKTNKNNINYIIENNNNKNIIKNNRNSKISKMLNDKTNHYYKIENINRFEEMGNISEINLNNNSQIVNNFGKKDAINYSFNNQEFKNHKKSYLKI